MISYLERGQTINSDRYCATLTRLREAIHCKMAGMLSASLILLHDNAKPNSAPARQELLQRLRWEICSQSPPPQTAHI
ncbi:hypothetical protein TNCT_679051 [Trichonephila clavata]|uniref:Uncharacterized protein n=1 Tax=Trichonephila clavata TaxID=2740835 RepID=A0A8X6LP43_TRICU|nr:hypothetical protein TNCT_679051 [Trichonephila clavata]